MVLKSLELVNFRNLENTKLTFSENTNIFFGNNAQGKTNLIEAIYLLSFLKSFRAETDQELIQWDQEATRITGQFDSHVLLMEVGKGKKSIWLNSTPKRALEVLGELQVASFSPEDILILTGAPSLRRRFLDSLISALNRTYLYNLAHLQKVIKNRNRVLLWLKEGRKEDLSSWDEQLVEYSLKIWIERIKTITKLNQLIRPISKRLLGNSTLAVVYQPRFNFDSETPFNVLVTNALAVLQNQRAEEIRRATTFFGPQRDDFSMEIEEYKKEKVITKDIGVFGSRGEQRVGVLSLKLGELDLIEMEKGSRPILLLDDVLSEFDFVHRDHLFALLHRQQTFITTTDLQLFPETVLKKGKRFEVIEGVVHERD